jgi:hypothetical protein
MHEREMTRLIYRAYIRDGDTIITGEALLLACLVHTKGNRSKDMADVQKIMKDVNLDKTTKERG